ncbi:MAG: hypothetical protein NC299_11735 [Lachnospiraceae bacterium]|nr:hypothetical protein [Ruminococcus sp.]MCM1276012.1 hypothetical protein [Lachnospiraceae bacterium]
MTLTPKEQEIINRVLAEKAKYRHLEADPPHEQDNIPNPFDVLSREELDYVREHRHMQELLREGYEKIDEDFKKRKAAK